MGSQQTNGHRLTESEIDLSATSEKSGQRLSELDAPVEVNAAAALGKGR